MALSDSAENGEGRGPGWFFGNDVGGKRGDTGRWGLEEVHGLVVEAALR